MMNIRDFDETLTKSAYAASNFLLKEEKDKTPAQKCRTILDAAENFYQVRQYKPAEIYFLDAKLSYEAEGLTNNINYSKVSADLGLLYATMGRYNSAEYYSSEALSIREQTLGKNSKAYASSLNNLAVLYQKTARFNESEKYFDEALKVVQEQLGAESQEYAIVLNNQAILFSEIGRTEQAVSKLNTAIAILDKLKKKVVRNQVSFQSNPRVAVSANRKTYRSRSHLFEVGKDVGQQRSLLCRSIK
ncbi:MAG: tetratricopeptide repeat protein [Flammeovirgaceae bacterium]|nr:tetratricopeptide repeat protein [Flammeovirgaceae bacterium]